MSERQLTKDELDRLAHYGIRYPWDPFSVLAALDRLRPLCEACGQPTEPYDRARCCWNTGCVRRLDAILEDAE